jgi:hypothetical protein
MQATAEFNKQERKRKLPEASKAMRTDSIVKEPTPVAKRICRPLSYYAPKDPDDEPQTAPGEEAQYHAVKDLGVEKEALTTPATVVSRAPWKVPSEESAVLEARAMAEINSAEGKYPQPVDPHNRPCSSITSIDSVFDSEPDGRILKVGRYRASDVSIDHEQPENFPSLWTSTLDGDSLALVGNPEPSLSLYD